MEGWTDGWIDGAVFADSRFFENNTFKSCSCFTVFFKENDMTKFLNEYYQTFG
jgi:hypothetical protein